MSRTELAELVNEHIWKGSGRSTSFDADVVARYERGVVRWPSEHYRVALRVVLGIETDAELGFYPTARGRSVAAKEPDGDDFTVWLSRASSLDAGDVLALARRTDEIRIYDPGRAGVQTSKLLREHLHRIASLRSFSIRSGVRADLASVYSDAASLAGWVRLDAGDLEGAWRLHEVAKDAGRESAVSADLVHAIAQQAYVLVDAERTGDALQLAEHAVEIGARSVSPTVRAWLHAVAGEIAAITDHEGASLTQFDEAARLLPPDGFDPDAPYVVLDDRSLARWRGAALARLGDEDAITNLRYALEGLGDTHLRAAAQANVDLCHSLLAAGHQTEAKTVLEVAHDLATRASSTRQLRRIASLELRLGLVSVHREEPDDRR
ncbi:hypothetical protein ACFS27_22890 [Promicromonospora vindobonensis]|uniref:Tetratricopeptide repeat protein n=1 Tax=Promicromonospora vindobonensis TaxID=195748 RepID=A0ABW5VYN6_9MICO